MKKIKLFIILFAIGVNFQISNSQNNDSVSNSFSLIDNYFKENIDSAKLAGSITLIAIDNKIQHLKSYGYLDIDNSIPMSNNAIIPIASMTKIITSIAVLQLYEGGHFLLDDPIEKYIPEYKDLKVLVNPDTLLMENLKSKPTIRDLLRHTSGMVYSGGKSVSDRLYREAGFRDWDKSLHEFVLNIAQIPLAFQPNDNWNYSYSHDVLGYLVEIVSGMSLNKFCQQNIFSPLGLKNTDFYVTKEKSNQLSNLYIYENGKLKIEDNRNNSIYNKLPNAISGGGGWWSSYGGVVTTIEEFYIISQMLLNYGSYGDKVILHKETIIEMISNQIGSLNAYGNKYGLGVGIIEASNGLPTENEIFWAGAPYNTYFWIDYKKKLIGILFTNTAPFGHLGMMDKFKELTIEIINKQ